MRPVIVGLLLAALPLAACDGGAAPDATPTVAPTATPSPEPGAATFEEDGCAFTEPSGRSVDCGYLTVPEDRRQPDGGKIRLHVAVFHTRDESPAPDPVVYLGGGPGEHSLEVVVQEFDDYYAPFLANRDLIVLDQRGTGYSQPALDCPELTERQFQAYEQGLGAEERVSLIREGITGCRDRLAGEGVNLAGYSSRENAADLEDLRKALGYEQWNLYGVSYGTRLALTAMRDFPAGIRSVVLDSAYPLQVDFFAELPANATSAFRAFFDSCANDPPCSSVFPDLEAVFYNLVEQLDANPAPVAATNPLTDETIGSALITGDDMITLLYGALRTTTLISALPAIIFNADRGDFRALAPMLGPVVREAETVSDGMYLSVQCNEEAPFTSDEGIAAGIEAAPEVGLLLASDPMLSEIVSVCGDWLGGAAPDPVENQPVVSDIPTLILAGQYDPTTPPAWGRLVDQDLGRSFYYELPRVGHGAIFARACPFIITLAFLDEPDVEPDTSCIADLADEFFFD